MANNEERFCKHCNRERLFFLGSDLIWYCDECGNFVSIKEALEWENCPICGEELDMEQLEKKGYAYDEAKGEWMKEMCRVC